MNLQIDVPRDRVGEITRWFKQQGVIEEDVVKQTGWLLTKHYYRVEFLENEKELAMLFKLSMGGS